MPEGEDRSSDYLSLYRRFRPQRFDEVLGQEHVAVALRNAVRQDKVAHAYLFSGPRGTGKTSTARILAKALNCADPQDGEPCGTCQSCVEISRGTSLDVHELDAASNNGVDAMRDLVARAALGTPGRWKVYIVDEVHMLSTQASNALLKTLEEPPGHVVFVLATTDAQKVLPTVRSRTQHFEFRLLGPEILSGLVHQVSEAAHLEVGDEALAAAVRRGRGSARDALSALDQFATAGVVDDEIPVLAELGDALAARDATMALVAVAQAVAAGRDVHTLTGALVEYLRQGFLFMVAPDLVSAPSEDRPRVEDMARRMGLPAVVRAMEALGKAQVDMRDAPDPRVNLEATLIRLAHPEADDSPAALLERIERLERGVAPGGDETGRASTRPATTEPTAPPQSAGAPTASPSTGPAPSTNAGSSTGAGSSRGAGSSTGAGTSRGAAAPDAPGGSRPDGGPDLARQSLGALRRQGRDERSSRSTEAAPGATDSDEGAPPQRSAQRPASEAQAPIPSSPGVAPTRDQLVEAWGDGLLATLPPRARARFRVGRFLDAEADTAVFALPNDTHRSYCEEVRLEVEQMLSAHFGTPVHLQLVVDKEAEPGTGPAKASSSPRGAETSVAAPPRRSGPGGPGSTVARHTTTTERAVSQATSQAEAPAEGSAVADEDSALLDPMVLAAETEPAGAGLSPEQRLKQVFPGAEEV